MLKTKEEISEARRRAGQARMAQLKASGKAKEFYKKATFARRENYRKYKELEELHLKTAPKNEAIQ